MANGIPVKDGSGKGRRSNKGRGGCNILKKAGQGKRYISLIRKNKGN